MRKMRKVTVWIGTAALMVGLMGGVAGTSSAANLTAGQYTYVINGEELAFPFDPVKVSNGLLLPVEVLQRFGVAVSEPLSRTVTLKKAEVVARITLGSTTFELDGQPQVTETAPLRLNGRLFLPADLLKHFGVDFSQDGTIVVMRDFTQGMPTTKKFTDAELNDLKFGRTSSAVLKSDTSINLSADFTLLNPDLAAAEGLGLSYGTRARIQSLMQSNTLVMVKLSNTSFKAGAVAANSFFLTDDQRRQYDLVSTLDTGDGAITAKISPGADRLGILVFPKIGTSATMLTLYFDPNGSTVGSFARVQ